MGLNCECDPDEGLPCEEHCEVLVSREGASLRTGDELIRQRIEDLIDLGVELDKLELAVLAEVDESLGKGRWLEDEDQSAALSELSRVVDGRLPDGLVLDVNDGYRILRLLPGCPLLEA